MTSITRRTFVGGGAAAAAAASLSFPGWLRATSRPNDEVRVAVVGLRGRGRNHIGGFGAVEGARLVALCDVDRGVLAKTAASVEEKGVKVDTFVDIRQLLERDDIDVVSIATPNHWHALMTIWACQAGKDVYVEKPVSHNVWEGRQMVSAAEKYGRIVQAGTQIRSSLAIQEAMAWIQEGHLGKIELARGLCYKPRQSIGKVTSDQPVDPAIDYDLWTGPAPLKPLRRKSLHYDWHWVFDTGNGDLGNQGVHQVDLARWALGESGLPKRVISVGGRFAYDDDGNTPNTQILYADYGNAPLLFEVRGLPKDRAAQEGGWRDGMDDYMGVRIGLVVHCEGGYLKIHTYSDAAAYDPEGKQLLAWKGGGDHYQNFIDAVRSRRAEDLNSSVLEGHLSAAVCHLGNASFLRGEQASCDLGRRRLAADAFAGEAFDRVVQHLEANGVNLEKDPPVLGPWLDVDTQAERFTDPALNALLTREYREPFEVPKTV